MTLQPMEIWSRCLSILEDNLTASAFKMWFQPIVPLQYEENVLVLQVSSFSVVEYIEENYIDLLRRVLFRVCGRSARLEYRVLIDSTSGSSSTVPSLGVAEEEQRGREMVVNHESNVIAGETVVGFDSQLNANYSFLSFVGGESNRLARAAGLTIAGNPGNTVFNPLFVYGGSGVGKTHLLNAIGNEIRKSFPAKRVLYVSASTFQVQYMNAIVNKQFNDFMNFYQTIDVLLVDDVQFFSNREGTQNAFFAIFNHLHQTGKQLILSSDRSPVELQGLQDRLITRFKWGLTAELKQPDFQLRKDILRASIYRNGLEVDDAIVNYIAENVRDNVRDLDGVLASLYAHSTLTNAQIDMQLAEEVVARLVCVRDSQTSIENIASVVCEQFKITEAQLMSKSRRKDIAQARQVAMWLAKRMTEKSLAEIGLNLGNRNHATVFHAIKQVNEQMQYDAVFRRTVHQIENILIR